MARLDDEEISKYLDAGQDSEHAEGQESSAALTWLKRGLLPVAVLGGFLSIVAVKSDKIGEFSAEIADIAQKFIESDEKMDNSGDTDDLLASSRRSRVQSGNDSSQDESKHSELVRTDGSQPELETGSSWQHSEGFEHAQGYGNSTEPSSQGHRSRVEQKQAPQGEFEPSGDSSEDVDEKPSPESQYLQALESQFSQLEADLYREMNTRTSPGSDLRSLDSFKRLDHQVRLLVESAQLKSGQELSLDVQMRKQLRLPYSKFSQGSFSDKDGERLQQIFAHFRHISAYFGIILKDSDKSDAYNALKNSSELLLRNSQYASQIGLSQFQKDSFELIHGNWFQDLVRELDALKKSSKVDYVQLMALSTKLMSMSAQWKTLDAAQLESVLNTLGSFVKTPSQDPAEKAQQSALAFQLFQKSSYPLIGRFGRKLNEVPTVFPKGFQKLFDDATLARVLNELDANWSVYRVDRVAAGLQDRLRTYSSIDFDTRKASLMSGFQPLPGMPDGFLSAELETVKDHASFLSLSRDFSSYLSELETSGTLQADELAKVQKLRNQLFSGFR